ncbi:ATP-grasp domain-containing protein [Alkalicoccus chagannorensis]|uniref:ATP-grasp domain-containing protein n=1 Tax=Alkalicoccus chagannorensis TaxID=427072 RepID=UPI000416FA32|nr:hypothetical protein [Alkalicoccus chagannorensis]
MRGWLIYYKEDEQRNQAFIDLLQEAAASEGIRLTVVRYEDLSLDVSGLHCPGTFYPDFLMVRTSTPWLNEAAELQGIRVFNRARFSRIANDKRLSHACVSRLGLPMLPSRAVHRQAVPDNHPPYPFIAKDPMGRGGTGVEWIAHAHQLAYSTLQENVLLQPVGGQRGRDVRVYIVGGEIQAAVLRESATNFKANISGGASSRLYSLSRKEREEVTAVTSMLPIDFAGIDFLLAEDGTLLFNEMEDTVGCRSLYDSSDINIAAVVMAYVRREMETILSS